jgi:hypothetical protein
MWTISWCRPLIWRADPGRIPPIRRNSDAIPRLPLFLRIIFFFHVVPRLRLQKTSTAKFQKGAGWGGDGVARSIGGGGGRSRGIDGGRRQWWINRCGRGGAMAEAVRSDRGWGGGVEGRGERPRAAASQREEEGMGRGTAGWGRRPASADGRAGGRQPRTSGWKGGRDFSPLHSF